MKRGAHVLLTKLILDKDMGPLTLPISYWSRGHLVEDITIGRPMCMDRYERSRQIDGEPEVVVRYGAFESSAVQMVQVLEKPLTGEPTAYLVQTLNSVWKVEVLPPLSKEC